jgi:hypothetical protein
MAAKGYIAGMYGQGPIWGLPWGGWLTSNGVTRTVARMESAYDLAGDCYNFDQVVPVDDQIKVFQARSLPTILLCYSLGVSFGTWYQTGHPIDLLLCIAGSSLGKNYPIHEDHCGRSVLISGSGIMSDWGKNAGFTRVETLPNVAHLLMDFHPAAIAIVNEEVGHLVSHWVAGHIQ